MSYLLALSDFAAHLNYYVFVLLMLLGLYAMLTRRHLVRKVVGLTIFQTAVILFFVSTAAKERASIPIVPIPAADGTSAAIDPAAYANPLPHVLMLTAIVVAVATLSVALAIIIRVQEHYQTLNEEQILESDP